MSQSQTKEYQKEYAIKNATKRNAIAKAHYQANKEKKLAYQKQYQAEHKEERQKYLEENKDKIVENKKEYYISNAEKIKSASREFTENNPSYAREWHQKDYKVNRDKRIKYSVDRNRRLLNEDLSFKNIFYLRSRLRDAFTKYSKGGKIFTSEKYGINYKKIFEFIGPCPGPREEYHIDHIQPLCLFNLDRIEDVKEAFAPSNHRWMKASENLMKSNKCVLFYL